MPSRPAARSAPRCPRSSARSTRPRRTPSRREALVSVTAADVKTYAPEFASLADPAVPLALADALVEINATVYGNLADKATKALAAHLLAVSYPGLYAG